MRFTLPSFKYILHPRASIIIMFVEDVYNNHHVTMGCEMYVVGKKYSLEIIITSRACAGIK